MKWVEIDGDTWYYAAKEYRYDVLLADNESVEVVYAYAHPDYNNGTDYFLNKALDIYFDE